MKICKERKSHLERKMQEHHKTQKKAKIIGTDLSKMRMELKINKANTS